LGDRCPRSCRGVCIVRVPSAVCPWCGALHHSVQVAEHVQGVRFTPASSLRPPRRRLWSSVGHSSTNPEPQNSVVWNDGHWSKTVARLAAQMLCKAFLAWRRKNGELLRNNNSYFCFLFKEILQISGIITICFFLGGKTFTAASFRDFTGGSGRKYCVVWES
jgi:hypothetical protein